MTQGILIPGALNLSKVLIMKSKGVLTSPLISRAIIKVYFILGLDDVRNRHLKNFEGIC